MRRKPLFPDIGKLAIKKALWVVLNGCKKKVHLGSIVEYSAFSLLSFITGGLIYGGCYKSNRTKVLGIRVDKKIYCKLDGKKKPRWYNINGFKLIEE